MGRITHVIYGEYVLKDKILMSILSKISKSFKIDSDESNDEIHDRNQRRKKSGFFRAFLYYPILHNIDLVLY